MAVTRSSRRRFLAFAGSVPILGLLGACGDSVPKSPTQRTDADAKNRWLAIREEKQLLALYGATIAQHPDLADTLAALRKHHHEHLVALSAEGPVPRESATTTPDPAPAVPDTADKALHAIVATEHAARDARLLDCAQVTRPRLAALMGSIAAAEASHAIFLEEIA